MPDHSKCSINPSDDDDDDDDRNQPEEKTLLTRRARKWIQSPDAFSNL